MAQLINDGYTLNGKVDKQGPWETVVFRYRPALPERVYEYTTAKRDTGKAAMKAATQLLLDQLVSWDMTNGKADETVPINLENLKHVPYPIFQKFLDAVMGYGADEASADLGN